MIIVVIVGYLAVGIFELPPLIKENKWKELIVYNVILIPSFIISILLSLGVKIPSPAVPIEKLIMLITGKLFS